MTIGSFKNLNWPNSFFGWLILTSLNGGLKIDPYWSGGTICYPLRLKENWMRQSSEPF